MPVRILSIRENSPADQYNLRQQDQIISINNNHIDDALDFQFYSADEILHFLIQKTSGKKEKITIIQDWENPLGIEVEQPECRSCINNCVFCFIHQMRPGLRPSLYLKDGDYRFSFIYGNFITLTNLTEKDYQKIIAQKLSPLYVSVHTTNPVLHKRMLRYKKDFDILEKLRFLSDKNIDLHTQIVVVPGWNDGEELEKTLYDLTNGNFRVLSIGVVPVGLTKYRNSLMTLETVNSRQAKEILEISRNYPKTFCSDEIFLLANEEIPEEDFYDDFPQLENGIGMIRLLLENWKINKRKFISEMKKLDNDFVFITGILAEKYIKIIADEISKSVTNKIRILAIDNDFWGRSVTVAGLLTAEDVLEQTDLQDNEIVIVPGNIFNTDGLTLDGLSNYLLCEKLNGKLLIIDEEFANWEFITN